MPKLNDASLNENLKKYQEYFSEDLEAIEEELKKSKGYSEIIDREIKNLETTTLGPTKGSQHYLIEHISNAVELQTQRQGLRRDRFAIKKAIIDYASKFADVEEKEGSQADLSKLIEELLNKDKNSDDIPIIDDDIDNDAEIDLILKNRKNEK